MFKYIFIGCNFLSLFLVATYFVSFILNYSKGKFSSKDFILGNIGLVGWISLYIYLLLFVK